MRRKFERQLAEKNTEVNMMKDKLQDALKKIEMLNL